MGGPERALVVGGAGFIGSHLVERLLLDGIAVEVVDDLSTGSLAHLADARALGASLKIHHLSAADDDFVGLVSLRRPDVVYHLAAAAPADAPVSAIADRWALSAAVAHAAVGAGVAKLVTVLPAIELYGQPAARDLPVKERAFAPWGLRGVTARAVVDMLTVLRQTRDLEFSALALATVYGPRQPATGTVGEVLDAALTGRSPVLVGDERCSDDYVFVDDVVDALVRAGARGSGLVINIGTGVQTTLADLWAVAAGVDASAPEFVRAPPGRPERFAVSPVRARIHLDWSPWTDLEHGLEQLR